LSRSIRQPSAPQPKLWNTACTAEFSARINAGGDNRMAGRLDGKIAIVTGAGTGIGEAIVHKFAREGAKVVAAGLS
jgi:3-oxoacyl-ACP reductase-like protein